MREILFPDIKQFKEIVRAVKDSTYFVGLDENNQPIYDGSRILPTLTFHGSVKLHGCNASVAYDFNQNQLYAQSRNRVLSIDSDNYGFAFWVESNKDKLENIITQVPRRNKKQTPSALVVYGEWAGPGIQSNVAISKIEKKSFFIFAAKIVYSEDEFVWVDRCWLKKEYFDDIPNNVYFIQDFKTFEIEIDFNNPERSVNQMVEWVNDVEKECPVGKELGVSGIGEGIVFENQQHRFKVKGVEHSATKVKTLIPVDIEKLNSIQEFVEYAVTENRLEQMIQRMGEFEIELIPQNIGKFFKFVNDDVIKEEMNTLTESGLEFKDVTKAIQNKAKTYYLTKIGIL